MRPKPSIPRASGVRQKKTPRVPPQKFAGPPERWPLRVKNARSSARVLHG
jgi:hypothetical protein